MLRRGPRLSDLPKGNILHVSNRHPAWHKWYDTARWIKRARYQLQVEPFCRMCQAQGRVEVACVVDHITPHRGDQRLFWFGDLQSLCFPCHNSTKRYVEQRGYDNRIGADGMPADPKHPVYGTGTERDRT
jgi:5-methylcytosine-specific restriction enzyme A